MTAKPSYLIVGRGRWAQVMHGVLSAAEREVAVLGEARRGQHESDAGFRSRLSAAMRLAGGQVAWQVAWLCVPPGPDVRLLVEAGVEAGLHVVVEKPWICSNVETEALIELARKAGVLVAVHYQYCFLDRVREWSRMFPDASGLRFSGRFTVSRPDRLQIPALSNLGSHLLAIREYAVPRSQLSAIVCGYSLPDERLVRIESDSGMLDSIVFLSNTEPLIQRFIEAVERSLVRPGFPLDLRFAMRVLDAIRSIESGTR